MSPSKSKRKISPYLILLAWCLFASCVSMNVITVLFQIGAFTTWTAISSPPSGARTIVAAEYDQVWVESNDGITYKANVFPLYCYFSEKCWEWKQIDNPHNASDMFLLAEKRGKDCEDLQPGIFPLNPKGQISQCIYTSLSFSDLIDSDTIFEGYFALMSNGNLFFWHNFRDPQFSKSLFFISTFIFPIIPAIIFSLLYAIIHIFNRILSGQRKAA